MVRLGYDVRGHCRQGCPKRERALVGVALKSSYRGCRPEESLSKSKQSNHGCCLLLFVIIGCCFLLFLLLVVVCFDYSGFLHNSSLEAELTTGLARLVSAG
eukprot:5532122-Amphidinium_carterae.1